MCIWFFAITCQRTLPNDEVCCGKSFNIQFSTICNYGRINFVGSSDGMNYYLITTTARAVQKPIKTCSNDNKNAQACCPILLPGKIIVLYRHRIFCDIGTYMIDSMRIRPKIKNFFFLTSQRWCFVAGCMSLSRL